MEDGLFARSEAGVPQGAGVSPLLANVYLHEFDVWAEQQWDLSPAERERRRAAGGGNYRLIRYADDFCVVSNDGIAGVRAAKAAIKRFLADELHLELSDEKTTITHVNDGFDFLGFHIQRVRPEGRWVVHLRPTATGTARVKAKIKALTTRAWAWMEEYTRLTTLNALVRGWAEYYRHTSLQDDIKAITDYTWHRYLRWLRKKHPTSGPWSLVQTQDPAHPWPATLDRPDTPRGDTTLEAYQWLGTPEELRRGRYRQKGRAGFAHPVPGPRNHPGDGLSPGRNRPRRAALYADHGAPERERDAPGATEHGHARTQDEDARPVPLCAVWRPEAHSRSTTATARAHTASPTWRRSASPATKPNTTVATEASPRESRMRRKSHAQFGEEDGEDRRG